MNFIKYVALGNDFVLVDWWDVSVAEVNERLQAASWIDSVKNFCHRKLGVGADGVLIVYQDQGKPCSRIFNQDGSDGQFCGNGARALAHYLKHSKHFPDAFALRMGDKVLHCEVAQTVSTAIEAGHYSGSGAIHVEQTWTGHRVNIGNPHLIIFAEVTPEWLKKHGERLENYFGPAQKTNVEFVWQTGPASYQMAIFERGVGYSEACGSGAMAVTQALHVLGSLPELQVIDIYMPGGVVKTWIKQGRIYLSANVSQVFTGRLSSVLCPLSHEF